MVAFATLTGDFHPQHVDAEWAAESPFGERIAHGLLILSLAAGMVDFDPEEVIALRRVRDVVFKRPVKLGDTIRVSTEIGDPAPTGIATATLRITAAGDLVARAVLDIVLAEKGGSPECHVAEKGGSPECQPVCVPL